MGKTKDATKAKASKPDASLKPTKDGKGSKSSKKEPETITKKVVDTAKKGAEKVRQTVKAAVESDDSSEAESEAGSETSASSDSSSDEEEAPKKSNGVKANGAASAKAKSESESDEYSEEESDEEEAKPAAKTNGAKATPVAKKDESSDDSEDDSGDSEDDSEDEKPAKKSAAAPAKAAKEDSDSDSDASGSDESSEEEEEKPAPKKRKAEQEAAVPVKKNKTEANDDGASPNLFVGSLSWNVDENMLREHFESFGTLKGVRVMIDRNTGKSKGFGYVEYEEASSAKKAYEGMSGQEIDGRVINLDYAKPAPERQPGGRNDRAQQYGDQLSEPSATLFIGNISFEANEEMISEAFQEYGSLKGVRLPTDPDSGNLKGYGYVEFENLEDAKVAIDAMKGYNLAGRSIRLDFSTPRAGGGGGGRGDRGGFRGRGGGRGLGGGRGGGRGDFRGGRGGGRGGGDRGRGRGGSRGGSYNRGGFGDYKGNRQTFD